MASSARQNWEQALAKAEAQLARTPASLDLQFECACLLAKLGRVEEAKQRYLEILHHDPAHFGALTNLGDLLYRTAFWDAARTVYAEAVARHPDQPLAHTNLANLLYHKNELAEAERHYQTALQLTPDNVAAHQGLSILLSEKGETEKAAHHRRLGFGAHPVKTFPYSGAGEPVPLLLLVSSTGGDLPWRRLVDENVFQVTTLAPAFYGQSLPLPEHRLIFNVIGDADSSIDDLEAARLLLARSSAPVVNKPDAVLATGRIGNAQRLRGLPGVVTPRVALASRDALDAANLGRTLETHGLGFPFLIRSPGFHMGKYFMRIDHRADLNAALAELPGQELLLIQYLNACGADGCARKYRAMMIGGEIYPLHLAISEHWKVHYYTAAMADHPAHQAEEKAFLQDMPKALGAKAMKALQAIQAKLGLDFGGIDFGINADGNVLLFEANATMLIILPAPDPQWDYRREAIGRALSAAQNMLKEKAGS